MKRIYIILAFVVLLAIGVASQAYLYYSNPMERPAFGTGIVASLGGLRSVASEVVWFRAEKMQREGRYGELVQLSSILTFLEPHVPDVWLYAAWNLSYNVSVRMNDPSAKWSWIHSGIKLLRDQGLKWNPGDPDICYDLAHMFELKVGHSKGEDAQYYRKAWHSIVCDVKERDAWEELSMNRARMIELERKYSITDWTNPQASAIYWASEGLVKADKRNRRRLELLIEQAKKLYSKS